MVTMSDIKATMKDRLKDTEPYERVEITLSMSKETFMNFMKGNLKDVRIVGIDGYHDDDYLIQDYVYLD